MPQSWLAVGGGLDFSYGGRSGAYKKFDDHFTAIAKFSHFESEGDAFTGAAGGPGLPTITQVSLEVNYTF